MKRRSLVGLSILFSFILVACGGGGPSGSSPSSSSNPPAPTFTPPNITGQWAFTALSTVNTGASIINLNLTQQTSTTYFASTGNVVFVSGMQIGNNQIEITQAGAACDAGALENVSVNLTFTSATQATFTLTDNGSVGSQTATGTLTVSADGTSVSGTYNNPAACGFGADNGTVNGVKLQPFSGTYSGQLFDSETGGEDSVTVTLSENSSNQITGSGTSSGAPFNFSGFAVGGAFNVTDTTTNQTYVGLYDPVGNDFLVYDINLNFLGELQAGGNPQAAVKTHKLVVRQR